MPDQVQEILQSAGLATPHFVQGTPTESTPSATKTEQASGIHDAALVGGVWLGLAICVLMLARIEGGQ